MVVHGGGSCCGDVLLFTKLMMGKEEYLEILTHQDISQDVKTWSQLCVSTDNDAKHTIKHVTKRLKDNKVKILQGHFTWKDINIPN